MFKKYYYADLYRVIDDKVTLSGSRIVSVWFFQTPVYAYNQLCSTGGIPHNMKRIR
jgi:hypothetical protein